MLGIKRNVALVVLGLIIPIIALGTSWNNLSNHYYMPTLSEMTQRTADFYITFWYMWIAGVLLAATVSAGAAGFISKEVTDGTLMLVAAKPVNRWQIIAGKLTALLLNIMVLLAISHLLTVLLSGLIVGMETDTLNVLLRLTPSLLLYAFIVAIFFGAVTVTLSVLLQSRIKIVIITMSLVILTFLSGAFTRLGNPSYETRKTISYFNPSAHMRLTYGLIYDSVSFWEIAPDTQETLDMMSGTPTYDDDTRYSRYNYTSYQDMRTTPIHPVGSLMILLALSSGALALSVWALNRKQL